MAQLDHYFRELVDGRRTGPLAALLKGFLLLLSVPYSLTMLLREILYNLGLFRIRSLPLPVISVGNITLGGTGKTPTVAFIARHLMARGKRVVVLSRGYGGSLNGEVATVSAGGGLLLTPREAGDEPCLLADSVPGLMVVAGADRYRAGLHAIEHLRPDIFILDDGYQHIRLHRDLNILLLDCGRPFGNGRSFPAGLLREPAGATRRADLVVYTRCTGTSPRAAVPGKKSCTSSHELTGVSRLGKLETEPFSVLTARKGVAFAGIADPEAFFEGLETKGLAIVATLAFQDHCDYGTDELTALGKLKQSVRPDYLITTAKDAVKLQRYRDILGTCYVAVLELKIEDPTSLEAALEKFL